MAHSSSPVEPYSFWRAMASRSAAWSSGVILTWSRKSCCEGGVAVEDVGAFGVDVEEIERVGATGELSLDAAEELA